jgi:hypothetical protein
MGEQEVALRDGESLPSGQATQTALDAAVSPEALDAAVPLHQLDPHDHEGLEGADHKQDIELKKTYAKWLLRLVAAQLVVADAVFIAYAWAGVSWRLDTSVVQAWLAATMLELIGVALVITRYLFPRRDRRTGSEVN